MNITCNINNRQKTLICEPGDSVQKILHEAGYIAVRNSDDGEGFAGSDTILVDGIPKYASLLIPGQIEGKTLLTPDGLAKGRTLTVVQQAMVDAGVVQSAYNAPAAALLITDLLQRIEEPARYDIDDALSGLFNRATGYKQFYNAVELAKSRLNNTKYKGDTKND